MKKRLLQVLSLLMAVLVFASCAATAPAASSEAETAAPAQQTDSADETQEVQTVTVVLPGPANEEEYYKTKLEEFEAANPDIDVELIFTPNEADAYGQAVQLMFSSNEGPDIFRVSASFPTGMLSSYAKGWLAPLDEFLTDDFKATFPDNAFEANGGLMIDGQIYGLPFISVEFPAFRPTIYNMTVLKEYGITEPPQTWDDLKTALETVKEESGGSVYGFGFQAADGGQYAFSSLGESVRTNAVDLHTTEGNFLYDPTTGMSNAANEGTIAAVEFIKELNSEGLMVPGWETANGDTMMQYLATGRVAVVAANSFWIKNIYDINPDVELALGVPLQRSEEDNGRRYVYSVTDPYYGMSSTAKYPEATWRVLQYISSIEFQKEFYDLTGRVPVGFRAFEDGALTDYMQENMDNADSYLRVAPNPAVYHEDATALLSAITANAPKPTLNELYLYSIINDVSFETLAQEYDTAMDIVVDEQVAKLQSEGSDITRDALIFPENWDMDENYAG